MFDHVFGNSGNVRTWSKKFNEETLFDATNQANEEDGQAPFEKNDYKESRGTVFKGMQKTMQLTSVNLDLPRNSSTASPSKNNNQIQMLEDFQMFQNCYVGLGDVARRLTVIDETSTAGKRLGGKRMKEKNYLFPSERGLFRLPAGKSTNGGRWNFATKNGSECQFRRYKGNFVAKMFNQKKAFTTKKPSFPQLESQE